MAFFNWSRLLSDHGCMRRRGWSRSRLAVEVGYTRARITQIMHLLKLTDEMQEKLLVGRPEVAGMTIRNAIEAAMIRGKRT